MSIQLITFDLDDTFWHARPVIDQAEQCLRDWLLVHAPKLGLFTLERLNGLRKQLTQQNPTLLHQISRLRQEVLCVALEDAGYVQAEALEIAEQGFQVFLAARHRVEIFPEVLPVLEQLQKHYVLGVLTNGNANVHQLGLGQYFQFALSAEGVGIGKPEPEPFVEALRRANVSAAEAVHVGDHVLDDIQGAKGVGMRAIWFNPKALEWRQAEHAPDAQIRTLMEIPHLIEQWNTGLGN